MAFDSPVHPTGSGAGSIQQEVTDPLETWNRMIFDRQANLAQPRLSAEAHGGHQTSPTDVGPRPQFVLRLSAAYPGASSP